GVESGMESVGIHNHVALWDDIPGRRHPHDVPNVLSDRSIISIEFRGRTGKPMVIRLGLERSDDCPKVRGRPFSSDNFTNSILPVGQGVETVCWQNSPHGRLKENSSLASICADA